jgi:hypothetical protein
VAAQQARLVDSGWFMDTRFQVAGELAGSSESHPGLHSSGGALGGGPKATIDRACPQCWVGAEDRRQHYSAGGGTDGGCDV